MSIKLSESHQFDGNRLLVKQTHDVNPALERAAALRSAGATHSGENALVGVIPAFMLTEWAKEAGVRWDDHEAMRDVLKRKMLSGEFSAFRVWDGKY